MTEKNALLHFFKKRFNPEITLEQEVTILNAFKKKSISKKELLFREGDSNTKHYIIEKGLLRLYLVDPKGKEINILFARENQVIGDLSTPEPTHFYLEATENSVIYSIEEKKLQQLIELLSIGVSFKTNDSFRRSYIKIQKRLVSILSKSAEENYLEFRQNYPDLMQRLPQYHIASYLGISAEFLSKIIAKTAKK
jgi:CRP-like cAMP-binding protein